MKHIARKVAGIVAVAVISSIATMGAYAGGCASDNAYRTYYLDRNCMMYYIDANGNKVVGDRYMPVRESALTKHRCNGRCYYQDLFGNRMYQSKRCG